jgi:hypothetical protein
MPKVIARGMVEEVIEKLSFDHVNSAVKGVRSCAAGIWGVSVCEEGQGSGTFVVPPPSAVWVGETGRAGKEGGGGVNDIQEQERHGSESGVCVKNRRGGACAKKEGPGRLQVIVNDEGFRENTRGRGNKPRRGPGSCQQGMVRS